MLKAEALSLRWPVHRVSQVSCIGTAGQAELPEHFGKTFCWVASAKTSPTKDI